MPKPAVVDHVVYADHMVVVVPDPSLRTCQPRPHKPDLTGAGAQKALADTLVAEDAARADCTSKLAATWESIDQANAKAAAANALPK